jgi:hypothetical protein
MLEKIREKYQIDYDINEVLNETKIDKLLNQVYLGENLSLLKEIQKRSDFEKAFIDMFDTSLSRHYDFLSQPYELFYESVKLIKKFKIELNAEDLACMLIENKDKRVKVFILESGLLNIKTEFSEKETQKLLKTLFCSTDRELSLDLLMQLPSFEHHAKHGKPTALSLLFQMNTLIMHPNDIVNYLHEHHVGWGQSNPKEAVTSFFKYIRTRDNKLDETIFNVYFSNILNLPQIKEQDNIVQFLRNEFSRFEVKAEIVEKGLTQLEKEILESQTQISEKGRKIKI